MKIKKSEQRELDRLHQNVRDNPTIENMILHGEYIEMLIEEHTDDMDVRVDVNYLMMQVCDRRASSYFKVRRLFNSLL